MGDLRAWLVRVSSFLRKEIAEAVRQPQLLLSLVLGPFLIVALFGAGLRDTDPTLRTMFVASPDSLVVGEIEDLADDSRIALRGVTADEEEALDRLRAGEVDLVVVFPDDPRQTIFRDERATVRLWHDRIDPIESRAVALLTRQYTGRVNEAVLREVVDRGQQRLDAALQTVQALQRAVEAGERGTARALTSELQADIGAVNATLSPAAELLDEASQEAGVDEPPLEETLDEVARRAGALANDPIPTAQEVAALREDLERLDTLRQLAPRVLVSPFRGDAASIAPRVNLASYYAPAVVALLLQHMVVTFIALSVVRDEELGTSELFRVAPLSPTEIMFGRFIAYIGFGILVAGALNLLLVGGLDVPMAGSWALLAVSTVALLAASISLGYVIALVSRSDTQAVQASMTVMLASILLSGFLLSLDRFLPWLQTVSWVLPVRHGVELFRNIMLRGRLPDASPLYALATMAAVLFTTALLLLRRRMRSA